MKADLRAAGNTYINNIVVGNPAGWYDAPAWIMVVDTYHASEPVGPGTWFENRFRSNDFFHEKPSSPNMVLYHGKAADKSYSVADLDKAFPGNFIGNVEIEPEFVDAEHGDFTLKAGSRLIDAGVDLSEQGIPFLGKGPDIGAVESESAAKR
jgi:hypothetical protein